MRTALLTLVLVLVATSAHSAELKEDVKLKAGVIPIVVQHPDGEEVWAKSVAMVVKEALPTLEEFAGNESYQSRQIAVACAATLDGDGRTFAEVAEDRRSS